MEELSVANAGLKAAQDKQRKDHEAELAKLKAAYDEERRDSRALIATLGEKENALRARLAELNKKKHNPARATLDASRDDLVEINAGGKVVAAKRSTLARLMGTRFEALFGGRWDKKIQRDGRGRIFLDVNRVAFCAIVDYLSELSISSEDSPPAPPSVSNEHKHMLDHQLELSRQLELFGLLDLILTIESKIIKDEGYVSQLHDWLKEDGSDGEFALLYRSTRDGLSAASFHSKCDNQGCTLTIIETADGYVLGGYSNTPWANNDIVWHAANKAFLFVLSGSGISSPCKMKLKNATDKYAVCHYSSYGPTFGGGHDLRVQGSTVYLSFGSSYESGPQGRITTPNSGNHATFPIKEMEVFQVAGESPRAAIPTRAKQTERQISQVEPVSAFAENVNKAINAKQEALLHAELELNHLEESFKDEEHFIANFASGDPKDVVVFNVSGTTMATKRSTLQAIEDSVLARQFDSTKWTEQGCNSPRAKEWTPADVASWASGLEGIPADVGRILEDNKITGRELLALKKDGLTALGIDRTGTLFLLLEEIEGLRRASQEIATLVEHSPYCFGKILDYLRMKQLHSHGLMEEPALPTVCDSQKSRFEKVVKYYFPGDSAKLILG